MLSETLTGSENSAWICIESVSPPVAAGPLPMGSASAGLELRTGVSTGSYAKTCMPVGAGILSADIAGVGVGVGVGEGV